MYTGPKLTNNNLVFGYDTGYGTADNTIVTRFYPGEPTTNLYTNSDFSNGETGWTFGSWDGNITHTATTLLGPYGETVSANKLTKNASSAYSHFHQYNQSKYASGSTYTTSAWVKGYGTFQIKSHWGGNTSFTMTGDWQRVSMTVTATSSSSSNFPYFAGESLTTGTDFYITMCQTELKSHATPYVYSSGTTGSRSDTASLIDLKKTKDIDVSDISFDSNGQPDFDGTNDSIQLGDHLNTLGALATFEIVFKSHATNDSYAVMLGWGNGDSNFGSIAVGNLTGSYSDESAHGCIDNNLVQMFSVGEGHTYYKDNKFHHMVVTVGLNNYSIWVDGVEKSLTFSAGSQSTSLTQAIGYNSNMTTQVGRRTYNSGSGSFFNGEIPVVKVYNEILTDAEIINNFNAYKNRFNI